MSRPLSSPSKSDWITDALRDLPPLLTIKEASALLRISTRCAKRWIDAGRLPALRHTMSGSARLLVPRDAVERHLRAACVSPSGDAA